MARKDDNNPRKVSLTERRMLVAEMYKAGKTQTEIAESLGVNQSNISRDIRHLVKGWWQSGLYDIHLARKIELDKLNALEEEYWKGWVRSCKDAEILIVKESSKVGVESTTKTIVRIGDPRFLEGIQRCVEQRIKLLGLNEPENINLVNFDLDEWKKQRQARLARIVEL
jgi:predicted transcriptional regulator